MKKLRDIWNRIMNPWWCALCERHHTAMRAMFVFKVGTGCWACCWRGLWGLAEDVASERVDVEPETVALDMVQNHVCYVERAGRDVTARKLRAIRRAATGHAV